MRGKYVAILVAIVVLGLIVLGRAGNTLVDWLWFSSIGYEGVFWTIFTARTVLFLAVFAASTGAFWLSGAWRSASRGRPAAWPATRGLFPGRAADPDGSCSAMCRRTSRDTLPSPGRPSCSAW